MAAKHSFCTIFAQSAQLSQSSTNSKHPNHNEHTQMTHTNQHSVEAIASKSSSFAVQPRVSTEGRQRRMTIH